MEESKVNLHQAFKLFEPDLEELKATLISNMIWSIGLIPKPEPSDDPDIMWVRNEVYKYRVEQVVAYPNLVLKRIEARQKPHREGAITDDMIEEAREYPIEDLYEGELRHGTGLCPFHSEKTGSFHVKKKNKWRCFGCDQYGDSISFYMKQHGCSFIQAVKRLST